MVGRRPSQQTQDIEQMLSQCWASVYDVAPTLTQHWFSVSCFLGCRCPPGFLDVSFSGDDPCCGSTHPWQIESSDPLSRC